jgi:hypothetical protein
MQDADAALRASCGAFQPQLATDENCAGAGFSSMTQAFSQRISELQQLVCFRVEGACAVVVVSGRRGATCRAVRATLLFLRHTLCVL